MAGEIDPERLEQLVRDAVPHSSGNGYRDGFVATIGQSGSVSPGRW